MNKAQQQALRTLTDAEHDFLEAYGWTLQPGGEWRHPHVNVPMPRKDAVAWTKNNPQIGWAVSEYRSHSRVKRV